ncbi:MAG: hypothetical protein KDC57_04865 [Saprospiraceae bacterium]|nr:hypothetical protein [Saprospiraceae bacterium]
MRRNQIFTVGLCCALIGLFLVASCKKEENFADPTITLSQTMATASPGNEVTTTVTITADPEAKSLVVTKLWDGSAQGSQNVSPLTSNVISFTYTVTDEDADHITTLNFLLTDSRNNTAEVELVIDVELTPIQLLRKYNWKLSEEVRKKTNTNDISDVYTDDVYQFNDDNTYDKSIGAKVDDFSDIWFNYCDYNLNESSMRLLMSRTGAFGETVIDTLNITVLDNEKLYADVIYRGLDIFDPTYDPAESFEKRLVAVAKTAAFDPYQAGPDDDNTGPAGMCIEVDLSGN